MLNTSAKLLLICLKLAVHTCASNNQLKLLKYVWGDALEDPLTPGPDGQLYPWDMVAKIAARQRSSRSMLFGTNLNSESEQFISPKQTREILLRRFATDIDPTLQYAMFSNEGSAVINPDSSGSDHGQSEKDVHNGTGNSTFRQGRESSLFRSTAKQDISEGCVPSRLCASTYNTTAPLYGISLTSGKPVTIVQKFPDLLQQVVYQICKTTECEVLQGECIQTYLPYLFLVLPLGPVTLTGQDYVLVESGCVCQPKYAKKNDQPSAPLPFIQPLNQ